MNTPTNPQETVGQAFFEMMMKYGLSPKQAATEVRRSLKQHLESWEGVDACNKPKSS